MEETKGSKMNVLISFHLHTQVNVIVIEVEVL